MYNELHAWNLCNFVDQCHPNKMNLKKERAWFLYSYLCYKTKRHFVFSFMVGKNSISFLLAFYLFDIQQYLLSISYVKGIITLRALHF